MSRRKNVTSEKAVLGAIAMDLKRVALGYHRGSYQMAERFLEEALKRKKEVDDKNLKPYLRKSLSQIKNLKEKNERTPEDALMYSTIFLNASR